MIFIQTFIKIYIAPKLVFITETQSQLLTEGKRLSLIIPAFNTRTSIVPFSEFLQMKLLHLLSNIKNSRFTTFSLLFSSLHIFSSSGETFLQLKDKAAFF